MLETIRVCGNKPVNLAWHQRRMDESIRKLFGRENPWRLDTLFKLPDRLREHTVKWRILYGPDSIQMSYEKYHVRYIRHFFIVENNHIEYSYKFADRKIFQRLKEKFSPLDEIIIVRNGRITDTSFSNLAFFDGKQWITPSDYLLNGTARMRLLENGVIHEEPVDLHALRRFTRFKLINAMLPWENTPVYKMNLIKFL